MSLKINAQEIPLEYLDPLSNKVMQKPRQLNCGHNIDESSLKNIMECPTCKVLVTSEVPNPSLAKKIRDFYNNETKNLRSAKQASTPQKKTSKTESDYYCSPSPHSVLNDFGFITEQLP